MEATGDYWKPVFFPLESRGLDCELHNAGPNGAHGFPQADDLFDPGLRAIGGLASTAAHTRDRPSRPGRPNLPET